MLLPWWQVFAPAAAADEAATDSDLSEHVEITIGGINMGSSDTKEGWPNEVVQKLEDKFNVTLSLKTYDNESLNLDLSGGNHHGYRSGQ